MTQKTKPTRNAINNALKNVKNDLLNHRGLTARAVRQLDEHRQTMEGFCMQLAETQGVTQTVVAAVIEHLGIDDYVRAIVACKVEEARATAEAKAASSAAKELAKPAQA